MINENKTEWVDTDAIFDIRGSGTIGIPLRTFSKYEADSIKLKFNGADYKDGFIKARDAGYFKK